MEYNDFIRQAEEHADKLSNNDIIQELVHSKMELDMQLTNLVRDFEEKHGCGIEIDVVKNKHMLLATDLVRTKMVIW